MGAGRGGATALLLISVAPEDTVSPNVRILGVGVHAIAHQGGNARWQVVSANYGKGRHISILLKPESLR
jgi:hypothetical protein